MEHAAPAAFYNTNGLAGAELTEAKGIALQQEDKVMAIFRLNPGKDLSPSMVWKFGKEYAHETWLLTSVRRSNSNLTELGKLTKLDRTVPGEYGRPEHTWRITFVLGVVL